MYRASRGVAADFHTKEALTGDAALKQAQIAVPIMAFFDHKEKCERYHSK
jgi:hypothetical protein